MADAATVGGRRPWADEAKEVATVLQWRYQQFRNLGFARSESEVLATGTADLRHADHLVLDLRCPLHYAFLILA